MLDMNLYQPYIHRFEGYSFPSNLTSNEYLKFARVDLAESNNPRNRINALSNSKRALHLQIDFLIAIFGFEKIKKINNFPKKLDVLNKLGVSSPQIIRKINSLRNEVEHDYILPSFSEVLDFVDIIELFLGSTNRLINYFPVEIEYSLRNDSNAIELGSTVTYDFHIIPFQGVLEIKELGYLDKNVRRAEVIRERIFTLEDNDFLKWVQFLIKNYLNDTI